MTRLILSAMVERRQGHIIKIGSIAGIDVYPGGNVYCASKSAVRTLTQALRMDVLGKSIHVTKINPGMIKTEFSLVRWDGDKEAADKIYEGVDYLSPEGVADVVVFCATPPPHVNIGELVIMPTEQVSFMLLHRKTK